MIGIGIDIIIIMFLLILIYISFSAGIIKSFFSVSAGFFGIILAENYPYQIGLNYYLIFIASALFIYIVGLFILSIFKFLYLSIFDKIAGACLGIAIWFILSANVVIPALNQSTEKIETKVTTTISNLSSKTFPSFGKYIPKFVIDNNIKKYTNKVKGWM